MITAAFRRSAEADRTEDTSEPAVEMAVEMLVFNAWMDWIMLSGERDASVDVSVGSDAPKPVIDVSDCERLGSDTAAAACELMSLTKAWAPCWAPAIRSLAISCWLTCGKSPNVSWQIRRRGRIAIGRIAVAQIDQHRQIRLDEVCQWVPHDRNCPQPIQQWQVRPLGDHVVVGVGCRHPARRRVGRRPL